MVRGVSGFNSSNANGLMLSSKNKVKNVAKHIDLPKKIAMSSLGILGIENSIKEPNSVDTFVMKCSDYEGPEDPAECYLREYCV